MNSFALQEVIMGSFEKLFSFLHTERFSSALVSGSNLSFLKLNSVESLEYYFHFQNY